MTDLQDLQDLLDKGREQNPGASPGELTDWLLNQAEALNVGVLYPAVHAWVTGELRSRVRGAERRAFSPGGSDDYSETGHLADETQSKHARPEPYVNPAQAAMQNLLSETCYVPGHGLVAWGELTAELHQLRIGYLEDTKRRYVAGVNATVKRHQLAVAVLGESGCRDLDSYAARFGGLPEDLAT